MKSKLSPYNIATLFMKFDVKWILCVMMLVKMPTWDSMSTIVRYKQILCQYI